MKLELIKELILDLVFPKNCFGCGKEGSWFCTECEKDIKFIKTPVCYSCRRISDNGKVCSKCKKKSNLSGVIITATYSGILKDALIGFKYQGLSDVAGEMSRYLIEALKNQAPKKQFVVMPIPLYIKRFHERGFNQSELMAKLIAKNFDWNLNLDLKKIKPTLPQVGQKKISRIESIKGSFEWQGVDLKDKNILLVDDVLTTGSTLEEAARILKSAGAKSIWGIILCRGQFSQI